MTLTYSEAGAALFVDGQVAAQSQQPLLWPETRAWGQAVFALGGSASGVGLAQGQLDEVATFGVPLNPEYIAWRYEQVAPLARLGPVTEEELAQERALRLARRSGGGTEMMAASGLPPFPEEGGGGGGGGGGTNPPPYSAPGLKLTKLTIPVLAGASLFTSVFEADTNSAYEIFQRLNLQLATPWVRVAGGGIGQTNFSLAVPSTNSAFFRAAEAYDSDFDGLSDVYETDVLHTSPTNADTDGDGIADGFEDMNLNLVPDFVDYAGLNRAVIYASRPNAIEGGQDGEVTILLPQPAPLEEPWSRCITTARRTLKGITGCSRPRVLP